MSVDNESLLILSNIINSLHLNLDQLELISIGRSRSIHVEVDPINIDHNILSQLRPIKYPFELMSPISN